jgi:hypothetical protein
MATNYTYKKIQEMRAILIEEIKTQFPAITVDVLMLVEQRLQTAVMGNLFDTDIKEEVVDTRIIDKQ